MTVQQAETILLEMGLRIALTHRFAFDSGTILRLENYAIINIFDDGRYYIQGLNVDALASAFRLVEEPWEPEAWSGQMPSQNPPEIRPLPGLDRRFEL